MSSFYIASGFSNKINVQKIAFHLKEKGWQQTYDWTLNNRAESIETLSQVGELEKEGIRKADKIIVILPGGYGTHVELGLSIAWNKKIFLYDLDNKWEEIQRQVTFYYLDSVTVVKGSIMDLIDSVMQN